MATKQTRDSPIWAGTKFKARFRSLNIIPPIGCHRKSTYGWHFFKKKYNWVKSLGKADLLKGWNLAKFRDICATRWLWCWNALHSDFCKVSSQVQDQTCRNIAFSVPVYARIFSKCNQIAYLGSVVPLKWDYAAFSDDLDPLP